MMTKGQVHKDYKRRWTNFGLKLRNGIEKQPYLREKIKWIGKLHSKIEIPQLG